MTAHDAPTTPAAFEAWLDQPGFPFAHPPPVPLDALFVAPPLVVSSATAAGTRVETPATDAVTLALDRPRLLVAGSRRSGRTMLAKRVVAAARARGEVAVYARGGFLHGDDAPAAVAGRLAALVAEQHEGPDQPPALLVLDDLELARLPGRRGVHALGRQAVLAAVEGQVERVVAFADDAALADHVNGPQGPALQYDRATIGALDPERRAAFASRFVEAVAPVEGWRAFVRPTREVLAELFDEGAVPAFPYYVLCALGELYAGESVPLVGSGYGPYYARTIHEAVIRAAHHHLLS
ncbi:hypothetical protein [Rubrivirga sp.]|uniref:hypothetical protein n=1 Tax=Rubrivirga sp. TaxID=1885344 RepID=UPI003B519BEE